MPFGKNLTNISEKPKPWLGGSYLHHGPAGLEAEAQVDVCAVGDPAAGGVGQEEVQAAHQVLGHRHRDAAGIALDRHCRAKQAFTLPVYCTVTHLLLLVLFLILGGTV